MSLILEHMHLARKIACSFAMSRTDVRREDLIGEAYLALVLADKKNRERGRDGIGFGVYADKYVRGFILNYLNRLRPMSWSQRQKARLGLRRASSWEQLDGEIIWEEEPGESMELRDLFDAATSMLSERDRRIMMLRFWDGLTLTEVARSVGHDLKTVWRVIKEWLPAVRERLATLTEP